LPHKTYRYYCLDPFGQLHNAESFHADSDDAAVAHVHAKHPDGRCEIWQEHRLVARLGFQDSSNPVVQSRRLIEDGLRLLRETAPIAKPLSNFGSGGDAR